MATALEVIEGALKLIGVLRPGQSSSTAQKAEGVDLLNLMIDQWRTEKLMCPWVVQESFALTSGDNQYSIGAGGDFNTVRPIQLVDSCFVRVGEIDYPLTIINEAQYNSITSKNVTGSFPQVIYYEPVFPLGVIRLWPYPGSGNTLFISSSKQLDTFPGTGTTLSVPPGYEMAYRSNLAVLFGVRFNVTLTPGLKLLADQSRRSLGRVNMRQGVLGMDSAITQRFPNSGYVYGDIT